MLQKKPKPSFINAKSTKISSTSPHQVQDAGYNLVDALLKHDQHLDERLEGLVIQSDDTQEKVSKLEQELKDLKKTSQDYDDQIATLEAKTSAVFDNATTKLIKKYLAIYERLKTDEKLFKTSCNEELERLQLELATHDGSFKSKLIVQVKYEGNLVERLKMNYSVAFIHTDVTDANKADLQAQLDKYKERIEEGRIELASINRKVATLKRQIEQVPNRQELREYRLRFSELYNQGMKPCSRYKYNIAVIISYNNFQ